MKTKTAAVLLAALALLARPSFGADGANAIRIDGAAPGEWTHDWDAAVQGAKDARMPLFVEFSGSDWCEWCKLLNSQVLETAEWKEWAKTNVYLVVIDFPSNKDPALRKYKKRNYRLSEKFGVHSYPTCLLLNPETLEQIGKFGASRNANPPEFIAKVEAAMKPKETQEAPKAEGR